MAISHRFVAILLGAMLVACAESEDLLPHGNPSDAGVDGSQNGFGGHSISGDAWFGGGTGGTSSGGGGGTNTDAASGSSGGTGAAPSGGGGTPSGGGGTPTGGGGTPSGGGGTPSGGGGTPSGGGFGGGGFGGSTSGNCCYAHPGVGCTNSAIMNCLCWYDDYCCYVEWDAQCAWEVAASGCGFC